MTLEQELLLSYYKEVASIDADHGVTLVQDSRSKAFYVKKRLLVYNPEIFRHLKEHPIRHTPRIRELVEEQGVLTVIEEYIPGQTLEQLLQQGCFPREQAVRIVIALCRILEDFHRCVPPIVNRDIKPSNIILTPDGTVKLLDINAAKWDTGAGIQDTVLLGTQGYAAPEQYGFGTSSVQTDIYALGVLLQELLTGSASPKGLLPGSLGRIVRRCTQLSPRNRFRSVTDLRRALEPLGSVPSDSAALGGWRRFLPPGFRSGDIVACFFSLAAYCLMGNIFLTMQVEGSPAEITANRVAVICISLGILLFSGNYMDIQRQVPLTRSQNPFLRLLGVLVMDALIIFLGLLLLSISTVFLR